jgi:hypothetical protein
MMKRIFTSLAITIIYFFLSIQGIQYVRPIDAPLMETRVDAARKPFSREGTPRGTVPAEPTDSVSEISVPVAPIVAQYNESDRSWTFFAKVVQLKDVSIYGRPGTIAKIEYMRKGELEYGWAVIQIDDFFFTEEIAAVMVGKEIRLQVSGDHVSSKGVNWDECVRSDKYCQNAGFIEGGFPVSEDYRLMICPSNTMIYSG